MPPQTKSEPHGPLPGDEELTSLNISCTWGFKRAVKKIPKSQFATASAWAVPILTKDLRKRGLLKDGNGS